VKCLLAWYSRTGTTERVAGWAGEILSRAGYDVSEAPIRPRRDLPYPLWLALSFVPGSRVPLAGDPPDPRPFDACVLALPKWTLSCPPANAFLARVGDRLPPTALVVTCGGWDQDRYLRALETSLTRRGVSLRGGLALRRRDVEAGTAEAALASFLAAALPA
jgi:hypothetical protein